jgi:hypothetical protein
MKARIAALLVLGLTPLASCASEPPAVERRGGTAAALAVDTAIPDALPYAYPPGGSSTLSVTGGKSGTFLVTWLGTSYTQFSPPDDNHEELGTKMLFGARVDANGSLLGAPRFTLATSNALSDLGDVQTVAFDGDNWLAVWRQQTPAAGGGSLAARRIGPDGALLDATPLLLAAGDGASSGYDGDAFLVAWPPGKGMYVTRTGARKSVAAFDIATGYGAAPSGRSLACDGSTACFFVGKTAAGIRGRRIGKGGAVGAADVVLSAKATDALPAVTFDGTRFVVGWQDAGTTLAVRVDPATSAVLDAPAIAVAAAPFVALSAATGQSLFSWVDGAHQV